MKREFVLRCLREARMSNRGDSRLGSWRDLSTSAWCGVGRHVTGVCWQGVWCMWTCAAIPSQSTCWWASQLLLANIVSSLHIELPVDTEAELAVGLS